MLSTRLSCSVVACMAGLCGTPLPAPAGDLPPAAGNGSSRVQPGAAGIPPAGDRAAYAAWNANGERWIHGVELRDTASGRALVTASRVPPWIAGSLGWRGHGLAYLPDNGVRIPERVAVSWWFDREAARRRDPATRQGPYVIALRGRIGPRALVAAASGDRRFMLEIGVGAGVVPPILRWHLLDREADPPGSVVERGGDQVDWQPTFWR